MTPTLTLQGKKAAYFTLGCKLNFAETSAIEQRLKSLGVGTIKKGEQADICIVNTCSVTEVADQKCRQAIHRLIRQNPGSFVVVMGCYAQLRPQEISQIPGVSLVVGAEQKGLVAGLIEQHLTTLPQAREAQTDTEPEGLKDSLTEEARYEVPGGSEDVSGAAKGASTFSPACSRGNRTRYFLKVQDGCNYFCTYCTIPLARGRSRNASIDALVEQAMQVAEEGGKEIVITGVNIGDFGRTTSETFLDLIRRLDLVEGIERYRISSIEPNLLSDDIISFCAQSRAFMPHFHIPLQSGSDTVLRLMHRRYDTALFRHKIEYIKRLIPDCFIGVDVIVGTRGETEQFFAESYSFIESLPISQLHVFPYSERPGTQALKIPHVVTSQEKHERASRLIALSARKLHDFYASQIGQQRPVLFEHAPLNRPMHGFTDNYIRIETPNNPTISGHIRNVTLGGFTPKGDALTATIPPA